MEKGARRRTESGPSSVLINREDVTILLDTQAKTYQRITLGGGSMPGGAESASAAPLHAQGGALVKVTSTIQDTGERKQAFGRTARRLKTLTMTEAPANACAPGTTKMETDGWYIDWPGTATENSQSQSSSAAASPQCRDTFVYQQQGSGKLGYPIEYTSTTWAGNNPPVTMTMKVADLSFADLDAALFEIPEGYREFSAARPGEPAVAAPRGVRVAVAPVANQAPGAAAYLSSMLNSSGVPSTTVAAPTVDAARAAGAEFLLTVETSAPKKKGGMFGKLAKSVGGEESKADFTLVEVASGTQRVRDTVSLRAGGMGAGAGMMLAAGVAGGAASAAGSHTGSVVANTMTHTMANQMMHSAYTNPQAGRMDPALRQVAYMSAYSPRYAAAQGAGVMAAHAATSATSATQSGTQSQPPEGALASLLDKVAESVAQTLAR